MLLWRLFRPRPFLVSPRKIVIVQLDHLGDGVLTTAMLPGLRAAYPQAQIHILASPSNEPVFATHPEVDRVLIARRNWFERRGSCGSLISAVWELGWLLRQEKYELGFDVRGDLLSVFVLALAGIPRRVGWSMGGGGFLLTDVASWKPGRHEVKSRLELLATLGITLKTPARVTIGVTDADRMRVAQGLLNHYIPENVFESGVSTVNQAYAPQIAKLSRNRSGHHLKTLAFRHESLKQRGVKRSQDDLLDDPDWLHAGRFAQTEPLLAVHLGAGTQAKRWPLRHWYSLIGLFVQEGWRVVILGGPDEAHLTLDILPHDRILDWTGVLEVPETTALLERADLFIGADSGPAHLAACARVPSVILFSGTNRVQQWRPWSRRSLVIRNKVACRPCHRKLCPLSDHPCLTGISPERVFATAIRWTNRITRATDHRERTSVHGSKLVARNSL